MAEPFLGEIRIFSFPFAPKGWALCNGQTLPINQNQALFSCIGGTLWGGNGQTTFALPNLQGKVPIHVGAGHALGPPPPNTIAAGEVAHTLTVAELPAHTHVAQGSSAAGNSPVPTNNLLAKVEGVDVYSPVATTVAMAPSMVSNAGGGQAHPNMQPYLALNFCIALQGIFPSPN